ncbi:carbohydrate-binding module family 6 protein [Poronia punctata]|nr:carbohydrate-binding module family 6 protein [Poronia punctata]
MLASVAKADNPIVQAIYTTDPAPVIVDDRLYVFTGHDEDGATTYDMRDWHVYSTTDMANWQDHGSPLSLEDFSWADANAWAGQVVERNGKFYYYVPVRHNTGAMAIGVAVADDILGPYKDAIGGPLVENNEIDPSVWIDSDGQAYLYWGNPNLSYVKLNEDMLTYSGDVVNVELTTDGFGSRDGNPDRPTTFEEGPWIYERDGTYYLVYAANCCSEDIRYSTGPSITGPWTYKGVIMPAGGKSFTNHPGVIDYKDRSYFFYHTGALPNGSGYQRSVAVESFEYGSDGSIPEIAMTDDGPEQVEELDPYTQQEAETMAWGQGVKTETCSEGGMAVSFIENGDYIKVRGVAFGDEGASSFSARVSSGGSGGDIEIRLGGTDGTLVGTCSVSSTGDWSTWETVECDVDGATGTQDLYFVFTGGSGSLFNFNWWQFS